jgi:hypothetical protein
MAIRTAPFKAGSIPSQRLRRLVMVRFPCNRIDAQSQEPDKNPTRNRQTEKRKETP